MTAVDDGIKLAQHLPKGTIHREMADEIVQLRAQLAGVRERVAELEPLIVDTREWGKLEVLVREYVLDALGGDA